MEFEWDSDKDAWTQRNRQLSFAAACGIFAGRVIERPDQRKDDGEARILATGRVGDNILTVVFTVRDGRHRIISARLASRRERAAWLSSA